VIVDAAGEFVAGPVHHRREADAFAGKLGIFHAGGAAPRLERAFDHLEVLLDRELELDGLAVRREPPQPAAGGAARHHPVEDLAALADADRFSRRRQLRLVVRRPLAHAVIVGHDARPRLERGKEPGADHQIHFRQQIDSENGGGGDVGRVQIALVEHCAVRDPGLGRVAVGERDQPAIEVHAETACPALFCRGDHHAPVARPEVDDVIAGPDFGDLQHRVHHVLRRLHVRGIAPILRQRRCHHETREDKRATEPHRGAAY
jgi:hypothetical protein